MRQEHRAGRQALRRLLREEAAHRRPEDGRSRRRRALRRRARCVELHVRRGRPGRSAGRTSSRATSVRSRSSGACRPRSSRTSSRAASSSPARYEPGIQRTYEELAQHYGTAILPARPGHPRDKAKVGGRCPRRSAVDPRSAPARDVLLARRAERADRGAARGPQRPADARVRREPARAVPRTWTGRVAAASPGRGLRVRRVAGRLASTSTTTPRSITTSTRRRMRSCTKRSRHG